MKVVLDKGAILPTKAHDLDAGWDLYVPEDVMIPAHGSAVIDTGVHIEIPQRYTGFIKSRSGMNVKHGIVSDSGVIDCGYTGSIKIKLYNMTDDSYFVQAGERVCQLVVLPICVDELEVVETLSETDRGSNGFGSSGKF